MNVLITGAANGLGLELLRELAKTGHQVDIIDQLDPDGLPAEVKTLCRNYNRLDLSDSEEIKRYLIKKSESGGLEYDLFICNAAPRVFKPFIEFSNEEIAAIVQTVLTSHWQLMNEILRGMLERGYGRLIVISSKSALMGYSSGTMYCSLKAAWNTFHESISRELLISGKDVTVTTICPDSFSDTSGGRYRAYDRVVKCVITKVNHAISQNYSVITYCCGFKTKLMLSLGILKRMMELLLK